MRFFPKIGVLLSLLSLLSCGQGPRRASSAASEPFSSKIISLHGAISEWLCVFGLEQQIVATDVTSNYPEAVAMKPKLGYGPTISAEGILSHDFDVLVALRGTIKEEVLGQVRRAGYTVVLCEQEYSVSGTLRLGEALQRRFFALG